MTIEREVTWVEIVGKRVDAKLLVCPVENVLYLDSEFDTSGTGAMWRGTCPNGHTWQFVPTQDGETPNSEEDA